MRRSCLCLSSEATLLCVNKGLLDLLRLCEAAQRLEHERESVLIRV